MIELETSAPALQAAQRRAVAEQLYLRHRSSSLGSLGSLGSSNLLSTSSSNACKQGRSESESAKSIDADHLQAPPTSPTSGKLTATGAGAAAQSKVA